jgi:hypothetical protein
MKIKDILILVAACAAISCKKTLDINPSPVTLNGANIYSSDGGLESAIAGMYIKEGNLVNGLTGIPINMGLAADELVTYYTGGQGTLGVQFYTNSLSSTQNYFWSSAYPAIYVSNSILDGLSGSGGSSLTPAVRSQSIGEAKFARALVYFYLVNLYGDVPMPLTGDYQANSQLARKPQADVYQQIVQDLKDAQGLLPDGVYNNASAQAMAAPDRVRPNRQAASALLARVYLYLKDYADAEAAASDVIGKPLYMLEPVLNNVFLKSSREIVWQWQQFTSFPANNADAGTLVVTGPPGATNQYPLANQLVGAFDTVHDKRWASWVGHYTTTPTATVPATTYYYAYKYKAYSISAPNTENVVVLRLAEQYLIRAEARAMQNKLADAAADLNAVRARAGLPATTAGDQSGLVSAILQERQLELFTEFGHRWFDLRRTGNIDAVMSVVTPLKGGGAWNTNKQLVPLPALEIGLDPNLTQNKGY